MQTGIMYLRPPRVPFEDEGYYAFRGKDDLLGPYDTRDAAERDLARLVQTGEFPAWHQPAAAARLRMVLFGIALVPDATLRPAKGVTQVAVIFVEPPDFGVSQAGFYVFEDENDVAGPYQTEADAEAERVRCAEALGLGVIVPFPQAPSAS
jgi:hypothetical protein